MAQYPPQEYLPDLPRFSFLSFPHHSTLDIILLSSIQVLHVTRAKPLYSYLLSAQQLSTMSPFLSDKLGHDEEPRLTDTKAVFPHIDAEPAVLPSSLDPFTITTSNGFMPLQTPTTDLPAAFKPLLDLADEMPIVKQDGQPGLLANYELGAAIDEKRLLPDLTNEIDNLVTADGQPDLVAVTAAFRDYSFLSSAYLLEPCWERYSKGLEGYGLGREVLPACLAGPLWKTAKM